MAHVRETIRNNITTALTGLTTTGSNVFKTRFYPLAQAKLPCLTIYCKSDASEYNTIGLPRTVMHEAEFVVEAYAKATSGVEDTLDTICVQVREALFADITRGGNAKDTRVVDFNFDFNSEGDQPVAVGVMTVMVDYVTLENDLETAV